MYSRLRSLAPVAALALALGAGSAEASCARDAELAGLQTRVLQTELMVAALSCGEADRYNIFIRRFKTELGSESQRMQAYFARVHGGRASRELNAFVTELANNSSQRSVIHAGDFCPRAAAMFDDVLSLEPRQLRGYAASQHFADAHGVRACAATREVRGASGPATAMLSEVKLPAEKPHPPR